MQTNKLFVVGVSHKTISRVYTAACEEQKILSEQVFCEWKHLTDKAGQRKMGRSVQGARRDTATNIITLHNRGGQKSISACTLGWMEHNSRKAHRVSLPPAKYRNLRASLAQNGQFHLFCLPVSSYPGSVFLLDSATVFFTHCPAVT